MNIYNMQDTSRDKLHNFFSNNRELFQKLNKSNVKHFMLDKAIRELTVPTEDIMEYLDELDIDWFMAVWYN